MVNLLHTNFNLTTSTSAIDRELQKLTITWKNVLPIPVEWNTPEVLDKRILFVHNLLIEHAKHTPMVYIDEVGFNLRTTHKKGRSLSGTPATLTVLPKVCISLPHIIYNYYFIR